MRAKGLLSALAGVACTALVIAGAALAAASTKITLNKGLDNPHGNIFSPSTRCLAGRKVIAFMQKGSTQNPKVDKKMDTTTSFMEGSHGAWDMGNPGFPQNKRYYVEATKKKGKTGKTQCKAAFSKTVKYIP